MDTVSLRTRRIGGIFGIVAALAMIPALLVGTPETPTSSDAAAAYYEDATLFLSLNGWFPVLHVFAVMLFLGVLAAVFRDAAPRATAVRSAAIGGGFVGVALVAAGFAAEVAYPAAVLRFPDLAEADYLAPLMLSLATWLYHFCQVGNGILMIGTALLAYNSNAFPKWFAFATIPFIVLALLHTWLPYSWLSAASGAAWIGFAGLLLLVAPKPAETVQPATS